MKIQDTNDVVVDRDGLATNNEFTMQFNAKMAKILSDGLYADKVQSIIRELSCNAVDSHVASGQPDRPIEVHLPTTWEPWFYVRDFGTGLDHDEILSVFTRYGASTKTHSNDLMGQLGLGSKSPFSYVDAFDVTSVKNGVRRQYSMYKNEQGMPSVALLDQRDTDEPNGVTVKMPVKMGDYSDFAGKAVRVYRWFTVKPSITGRTDLNFDQYPILISGTDWNIYKLADYSHMPPMAVMGLVAYPIERDILANLNETQLALLKMPISMQFDIGDLEISASREALGYDPRTQAAIRRKLDHVYSELKVLIEDQFKSATTLWEAKKIWYTLFEKYDLRSLKNLFASNGITWNGEVIKNSQIDVDVSTNALELRWWKSTTNGGVLKKVTNGAAVVVPGRGDTVIINDDGSPGKGRVKLYCEANDQSNSTVWYFHSFKDITVDQLREKIGNVPCVLTSQLPAQARKPRQVNMAPMAEINYDEVTAMDIDMNLGGVYVELNNRLAVYNNKAYELRHLHNIRSLCVKSGILTDGQKLYAPRRSMKTKIKDMANWTNLFDLIAEKVKSHFTSATLEIIANTEEFKSYRSETKIGDLWNKIPTPARSDSVMSKYILTVKHMESIANQNKNNVYIVDLAKGLHIVPALPAPAFNLRQMEGALLNHYPMLRMAMDHYYGSMDRGKKDYENMVQYVNIVDTHIHTAMQSAASSLIAIAHETA